MFSVSVHALDVEHVLQCLFPECWLELGMMRLSRPSVELV
jgi:hypothetical protein